MQDGATSHTANPVNAFLTHMLGEDRIVSWRCRYPWPPRFPDLTPADFWLWGYLKSRVYLSGPLSLSELKDAIRREISSIHPDMFHSAVAGFVTRLNVFSPVVVVMWSIFCVPLTNHSRDYQKSSGKSRKKRNEEQLRSCNHDSLPSWIHHSGHSLRQAHSHQATSTNSIWDG
ncbi:uncharacterized protein TNCV_2667081 [Trichonephila clavipes]|nr:uncharacterized protein TNCV_2667081 [Trichonephila clavipes]